MLTVIAKGVKAIHIGCWMTVVKTGFKGNWTHRRSSWILWKSDRFSIREKWQTFKANGLCGESSRVWKIHTYWRPLLKLWQ